MAQSQIETGDIVRKSLLLSEPFVTQAMLNAIVVSNYTFDPSRLLLLPLLLIPTLLPLLGISGSDMKFTAQDDLFRGLNYGLAGNIHGEFYAMFGYGGVVIYVLLQHWALVWAQQRLLKI